MSPDPLLQIRDALNAGNKKAAQKMLRPLLDNHPSAEVWRLAAQACTTTEKAIVCLRHAVALDPFHDGANRLLYKLESAQASMMVVEELPSIDMLTAPAYSQDDMPTFEPEGELQPQIAPPARATLEVRRRRRQRGSGRTLLLVCLLLLAVSISVFTMNLVGIISGPITAVTTLLGGATPVREIDGVPINQVDAAPLVISPSKVEALDGRDTDVLEPGYQHEYTFDGRFGQEAAIYVQFLSVAANRVSRNVVVLRPNGSDATAGCTRDTILQGDNNVALTCTLDASGEWKVRILGRAGESVGVYFVGVEQIGGL